MSKRTIIVLAAVATALAGFIFVYERHALTSGELEGRRDRLLPSFVRDRVTKLEIERADGRIVLERERAEGDDEDEDEVREWKLVEPIRADTDFDAVDSVMGALEWADARRTLEGVSAEDRATFGLDDPRLRAFYTVADQRVPIAIGGDDPQESGLYLQLEDESVAYVVGRDLFEALDHDASWFRSKELLAAAGPNRAERVVLEGEAGERVLVKREGRWSLESPVQGRASGGAMSDMLRRLEALTARRFVAEAPEDLSPYGLDAPAHVVHLSRPRGDGGDTVEATLRVGRACDEHEEDGGDGQVYGRVDDGPVVCVDAEAVEPLGKTADELRERRLVTLRDDEVDRIELVSGNRSLAVWREGGAWQLRSGDGAPADADERFVADFLRDARAVTAMELVAADEATVRANGLTSPVATLTLFLPSEDEEEHTEVVTLGRARDGSAWARRGDEPSLLQVDPATVELLSTSPARFRARQILDESDAELTRFTIRRAQEREVAERTGDGWRVVEPIAVAADDGVMRTLTRGFAALSAERFVAEQAAPEHGLERPRFVVEARFEREEGEGDRAPIQNHVVRIGAETEGGAFARLDDDRAVFLIDRTLVDAVASPLVDRGLLATDERHVARVVIERGARRDELRREAGGWVDAAGAAIEGERASAVLRRLETLRAVDATGYGPAALPAGLARPRARVTITRTTEAPEPREQILLLGAEETRADRTLVHARRTDVDVTFLLSAEAAAPFLAL